MSVSRRRRRSGESTFGALLEEATRRDGAHNHNHYLDEGELRAAAGVLYGRATRAAAPPSAGKRKQR